MNSRDAEQAGSDDAQDGLPNAAHKLQGNLQSAYNRGYAKGAKSKARWDKTKAKLSKPTRWI